MALMASTRAWYFSLVFSDGSPVNIFDIFSRPLWKIACGVTAAPRTRGFPDYDHFSLVQLKKPGFRTRETTTEMVALSRKSLPRPERTGARTPADDGMEGRAAVARRAERWAAAFVDAAPVVTAAMAAILCALEWVVVSRPQPSLVVCESFRGESCRSERVPPGYLVEGMEVNADPPGRGLRRANNMCDGRGEQLVFYSAAKKNVFYENNFISSKGLEAPRHVAISARSSSFYWSTLEPPTPRQTGRYKPERATELHA